MLSHSTTTGLGFLLLLAFVALDTSALVCDFSAFYYSDIKYRSTITSQEDANAKLEGCTTIEGSVDIAKNYTGSLYLPNITAISNGIRGEYSYYGVPNLTSIEAPSLTSMGTITISNAPLLTNISFPLLSATTSQIYLDNIGACAVNFPSLAIAGGLEIAGPVSSFDFRSLTRINGTLFVSSRADFIRSDRYVDNRDYPLLDVSFPALQNALSVIIKGNFSRLSLPRLTTIRDVDSDGDDNNNGLSISSNGNPLNLSLPSLSNVTRLMLRGSFSGTSLPSLLSTERFSLVSVGALDVDLGPLASVGALSIEGDVTGLSLPAITSIDSLEINTKLDIDCTNAAEAWERANHTTDDSRYHCSGLTRKEAAHRKMLLGVEIGIPVFVAACICAYVWRRKLLSRRKKKDAPPQYELDSPPPTYASEAPPQYTPPESRGGQGAGDGDAAAAGVHVLPQFAPPDSGSGEGGGEGGGEGDAPAAAANTPSVVQHHGEGHAAGRNVAV